MFSNEMLEKFHILQRYDGQFIEIIENALGISRRKLISDITNINYFLSSANLEKIEMKENKLIIPNVNLDLLIRNTEFLEDKYVFQEERPFIIIIYLFLKNNFISVYHFQDLFKMSKNSVLQDIKNTNNLISNMKVEVQYSRKDGYEIIGDELAIRSALEYAISNILKFKTNEWIFEYIVKQFDFILPINEVKNVFLNTEYSFVDERLKDVVYLTSILSLVKRNKSVFYKEKDEEEIRNTKGFEIVEKLSSSFSNLLGEEVFLATRILSTIQGEKKSASLEIINVMEQIISKVKGYTGVDFPNNTPFRDNLLNHLVPAIYRLKYGIRLINPVKEQIKEEYSNLFYLTKKSLYPLEKYVDCEVNDDETAYFTMHFGGYLSLSDTKNKDRYKAVIVCPNGISSSLIISEQIRTLMPEVLVVGVYSSNEYKKMPIDYDMVFSTTHIDEEKPNYLVKTIMNQIEKTYLKRKVYDDFNIQNQETQTIDDLLQIIIKNAEVKNTEILKLELTKYFLNKREDRIMEVQKDLEELLKDQMISIFEEAMDWKEAIKLSARKLLEKDYIEESYINDMIESVENSGPYIVLAPKVAVPHARPNGNVKKLGISLTKFKNAVNFRNEEENEDNEVYLIFTLAAVDSTSHLNALQQLATILDDEEVIEKLIKADEEEMLKIIDEKIKEEE